MLAPFVGVTHSLQVTPFDRVKFTLVLGVKFVLTLGVTIAFETMHGTYKNLLHYTPNIQNAMYS